MPESSAFTDMSSSTTWPCWQPLAALSKHQLRVHFHQSRGTFQVILRVPGGSVAPSRVWAPYFEPTPTGIRTRTTWTSTRKDRHFFAFRRLEPDWGLLVDYPQCNIIQPSTPLAAAQITLLAPKRRSILNRCWPDRVVPLNILSSSS